MSRIPSQSEYAAWRADFKARYKAAHTVPDELQDLYVDRSDALFAVAPPALKLRAIVTSFEGAEVQFETGMQSFEDSGMALREGLDARLAGRSLTVNPHKDGTDAWYSWFKGYGLYDPCLKIYSSTNDLAV
jgi:hypothetical protein